MGPLMAELVGQNARDPDVMRKVVDVAQMIYAVAVKLKAWDGAVAVKQKAGDGAAAVKLKAWNGAAAGEL